MNEEPKNVGWWWWILPLWLMAVLCLAFGWDPVGDLIAKEHKGVAIAGIIAGTLLLALFLSKRK